MDLLTWGDAFFFGEAEKNRAQALIVMTLEPLLISVVITTIFSLRLGITLITVQRKTNVGQLTRLRAPVHVGQW